MPTPPFPASPGPHLLVSVRNVAEAREAVAGGCRILDIKDPDAGSLGMAPLAEIEEISAWLVQHAPPDPALLSSAISGQPADAAPAADRGGQNPPGTAIPLSVALGELSEWPLGRLVPCLPAEVGLLKLGLAGCGGATGWAERWQECRQRISAAATGSPQWVAVCYADWTSCEAPPPREILRAAVRAGCTALLIDTYRKNGQSLLDWLKLAELRDLLDAIRSSGLRSAVAGSLQMQQLPLLTELEPDVIAVRTAACQGQSRVAPVCRENVQQLSRMLRGNVSG